MTKELWLQKVLTDKDNLRQLVQDFHPASVGFSVTPDMPITAPNAESASVVVRNLIRKETKESPVTLFDKAITESDTRTLNNLLSSAWFGVPESTSCWNIPGFTLLVDLLEDPVEQEEQQEEHKGWPGDGTGEDDLADYNQNEADDYRNE